ncbi:MAG: hypothetical protein OHK0022_11990 [Roseiflexaceae bacterium]
MNIDPQDLRWAALSPEQQALVRKLIEQRIQTITTTPPSTQTTIGIPRLTHSDALPLSFAQQRLWFFHQLVAGSPVYNSPLTADLRGPLDRVTLVAALQQAVQRHEVFRTTFYAQEGRPSCSITSEAPLEVNLIDLSGLPEHQQEGELEELILSEAAHSFNLSQPPLIRATLIICEPERHILLVNVHHIVCDGQSEALLFQEVQAIYNAACTQQPPDLPQLPIRYVDFAAWQRQVSYSDDLAYWADKLASAPPMIDLNISQPAGRGFSFEGRTHSLLLPRQLRLALRAWSEQAHLTPFTTLFTAFATLLHHLSGQTDLVIGTLVDDRPVPEVERVVGLFLNPLPIRAACADDPPFKAFAQRIQEALWGAIEHQHVPFEQIVAHVLPSSDRSLYPIFNVMVSQEIRPQLELQDIQADLRFWDNDNRTAKYDLSLAILESPGETRLNIACSTAVFSQGALDQFAEQLLALLAQLPAQADQPLSALRGALPASEASPVAPPAPQASDDAATPTPEVTTEIVAIWAEVLTVDPGQIELDSSFFELGGHSLLALQVIARVLEQFQSMLPADTFEFEGQLLNALFEQPTVRTMALMVDEALAAEIDRLSEDEVRQILHEKEG